MSNPKLLDCHSERRRPPIEEPQEREFARQQTIGLATTASRFPVDAIVLVVLREVVEDQPLQDGIERTEEAALHAQAEAYANAPGVDGCRGRERDVVQLNTHRDRHAIDQQAHAAQSALEPEMSKQPRSGEA